MGGFDYRAYFGRIRDLERFVVAPHEVVWQERHRPPTRPVEVVLYLGCNVLITAHLAIEVVEVFRRIGVDFVAVAGPQFCCGIVHHGHGDVAAGKRQSAATIRKLASFHPSTIVMWCPSCHLHFDDVVLREVAPDFGPSITHATQFLADRVGRIPFRSPIDARVAVHTHEHRPQQRRDADACLRLLRAVPGVEIVGTVSSSRLGYHCPTRTSAGERAAFVEDRARLCQRARDLGADRLVTIYHSCQREWCDAEADGLRIENYISVVAESLGCKQRDRYQRLRRATSMKEALSVSREQWRAHGLNEGHALSILTGCLGRPPTLEAADDG